MTVLVTGIFIVSSGLGVNVVSTEALMVMTPASAVDFTVSFHFLVAESYTRVADEELLSTLRVQVASLAAAMVFTLKLRTKVSSVVPDLMAVGFPVALVITALAQESIV